MTESEVSTATTSPEGENLTNRASWCSSVISLVESNTFQTLQESEFNQEGKAVAPNSPVPTGSDERVAEQIDRGNVKFVPTQHVQQTAVLQTPHEDLKLAIFLLPDKSKLFIRDVSFLLHKIDLFMRISSATCKPQDMDK
jgi:hypothetical protein